jgi:hypothetical protein
MFGDVLLALGLVPNQPGFHVFIVDAIIQLVNLCICSYRYQGSSTVKDTGFRLAAGAASGMTALAHCP